MKVFFILHLSLYHVRQFHKTLFTLQNTLINFHKYAHKKNKIMKRLKYYLSKILQNSNVYIKNKNKTELQIKQP